MTDDIQPIDPHNLLASGEELATEAALAKLLSVPRDVLHSLLHGPMHELVRFVRMPPGGGPWRHSVADARQAIEPHRGAIAERRRKADERQAANVAAAEDRRGTKAAAHKAHVARKAAKAAKAAPKTVAPPHRAGAASPVEVLVRRRPGA
jgi:hypothetical protein